MFLIVYGSSYPWEFRADPGAINPLAQLMRPPNLPRFWLLRDVLVNIGLYVPVGACAFLAARRNGRIAAGAFAVLLGSTLSFGIELVQAYEISRSSSFLDVLANGAGSGIGVVAGIAFDHVSKRLQSRSRLKMRIADRSALAVLACWFVYLTFPFAMERTSGVILHKWTLFLNDASRPMALLSATVTWFSAGFLMMAAGLRPPVLWLACAVFVIPFQIVLAGRQPALAHLIGAAAGCILFTFARPLPAGPRIGVASILLLLICLGVMPWALAPETRAFSWIPFAALIEGEWYRASLVLIEKLFYYGMAVWMVRFAGVRLRTASLAVAGVLAVIEVVQMRLATRTPEITDPILAVLIGLGCDALRSPQGNILRKSMQAGNYHPVE